MIRRGEATETVEATALFVFIGATPRTSWLTGVVARDERGFVLSGLEALHGRDDGTVDQSGATRRRRPAEKVAKNTIAVAAPGMLETDVPGVFVAGDVRAGSVKRVASAVGEGAMAVMYVHEYLRQT